MLFILMFTPLFKRLNRTNSAKLISFNYFSFNNFISISLLINFIFYNLVLILTKLHLY